MDLPDDKKQKKMLIAELVDLNPMTIFDKTNREHNMIATSLSQYEHVLICDKSNSRVSGLPQRRNFQMLDAGDQRPVASILFHMIPNSHLSCISVTDYTEMDENIATILNIDWTRRLWMRVVCARVIEGLILVNPLYNKYPTLDAHNEQTKAKSYQSLNTTLSHPATRYPNVELFIVEEDNGLKLELGTKIINVLLTSSTRMDKYLSIRKLHLFDEYAQLRQQTSCARCLLLSGHLPTITLVRTRIQMRKIASQLFRAVAASVWEQSENFILSRHCVNDQQKNINRLLTNLANEISPSRSTANAKVTHAICQIFTM
ncbi:hypothetical protein PHYBLDRAFT_62992 [Phycomyces blakesleeanus NRRL 1555(-)]|uniref:Uncharacterized protein n=1 Tax=Phycomyces blakesleeanus (strain ATCC 8743b / DSM 1359 / FGSC 10004 / NBRC 33097 / NRRL 1555) TaxID=763407 RepID=A0A167NX87_PHYB8|nr:hypothetical protein PHYBLDRAFT_62992 [Phycomyces blakesleeanus NRRL 1555(-)]OAD76811.1 hypothetical protein PHYBLDRAFT_62992 [Phycomyces blakesleeanus NRRL 1555(-)]|eukprot:XP_018294851.1 hypothetical protein PHYBLDRAFT_62992 [Phycomyces blakesleeanus NRRL 1555(-)]